MKPTIYRRILRHPTSRKAVSYSKDTQQEQTFFGESPHDPFFKPVAPAEITANIQRKCADCEDEGMQVQRTTDKKDEEKLMKKESPNSNANTSAANYISAINGKGQSMSTGVQTFYESRMGADFSDVKIHAGKEAAESARDINAQAYAYGNHIVFNEGKYQPETGEGKHLLAHELAHVMQKDGKEHLNRKIKYKNPTYLETDAVQTVIDNKDLALTTPTVNGIELPNNLNDAGEIIFKAFDKGASIKKMGKNNACIYNEPEMEVSANIAIIKAPTNKKWIGQANGASYERRNRMCKGVGSIPVEMTGEPDAATVYSKIKKNELEHFTDLKSLSAVHLERLMTLLKSFNLKTVASDADCQKKFLEFVGNKDALAIKEFLEKLASKVTSRDVKPGPHHFLPQFGISANCDKIDIKIKLSI